MSAARSVERVWIRRAGAGDAGGERRPGARESARRAGAHAGGATQLAAAGGAAARFNAAMAAWNPAAPPDAGIAVPSPGQAWNYTATFQWTVNTAAYGQFRVRGHVHYYDNHDGTYIKAPGNSWVSGIPGRSVPTPAATVAAAPATPHFAAFGGW